MSEHPIANVITSTGVPALVDSTREFVEKLFGPAVEEAGELFRDYVRSYRWRNQVKVLQKAHEYALEAGLRIESVPLRTLVPLLEGAGLEDEPLLQQMWAGLLASAGARTETGASRPAFVEIMKQLSPAEAWILSNQFVTNGFPLPTGSFRTEEDLREEGEAGPYDRRELATAMTNLTRLGIVTFDSGQERDVKAIGEMLHRMAQSWNQELRDGHVLATKAQNIGYGWNSGTTARLTPLGFQFLHSILPPAKRPVGEPEQYWQLVLWERHAGWLARDLEWDAALSQELVESAGRAKEAQKRIEAEKRKEKEEREARDDE